VSFREWMLTNMENEKSEIWNHVLRAAKVAFFLVLAALAVWRANSYIDPRSLLPQVFLCATAMILGFTAFSIGLGFVVAENE
jgi:polyferredoxin